MPVAAGVPGNGRAWEVVTPTAPIDAQLAMVQAISAEGDEVSYLSAGALPGATSGWPLILSNLARRTASGWESTPITNPDPEVEGAFSTLGSNAFGPRLGEFISTHDLPPGAGGEAERGIFRHSPDGSYELLTPTGPGESFKGASGDLTHVLFATSKHLLAGDAGRTEGESIYEVYGSGVRLVDVAADGSLLSSCGSTVPKENPISRDGRRIFFMTQPSCAGPKRAYMREDGSTTKLISASACGLADCGPEADVTILGATPSGSSAYLLTTQKLTDEDDDSLADLYRYDVADGSLTLLSAIPGQVAVGGEPVVASPDGSRVLFRASDESDGENRLYLATAAGPRLLASSAEQFVQLSSDGRFALFCTRERLLGADEDESLDVYRYDAASNASTLISAGPGTGNGAFDTTILNGFDTVFRVSSHPYRAMSDDGSDVFFGSSERLLPEDGNEVADVYEWNNGNLSLLSAGSGDRPSVYLGTTADGRTAFFRTALTLLPIDRDGGETDFYAARVGGGFPEPATPTACGEACLPPLGEPIRHDPPATTALGGGLRIQLPPPAVLRRNAAAGWIRLLAEVPAGGRLTARARARLGHRPRDIAQLSRRVAGARSLALKLRLSPAARGALSRGRRLRVRLVLRLDPAGAVRTASFVLGGAR